MTKETDHEISDELDTQGEVIGKKVTFTEYTEKKIVKGKAVLEKELTELKESITDMQAKAEKYRSILDEMN